MPAETTSVGIDVGGTFTDLYLTDGEGPPQVLKVRSTPKDPSEGLLRALVEGEVPTELASLVHGTTIATNAVIERRGARCALITTAGFRDVLEMGRRDRPSAYGLTGIQRPLVPRDLRFDVPERMSADGTVLQALDEAALHAVIETLRAASVDSVVVSFLHSYANQEHERRAKDLLLAAGGGWEVVVSSDVVREYYEFERTSTAVVQGYLAPLVGEYARRLVDRVSGWGFDRDVFVMQSNGGVIPAGQLAERAAAIVRSGPAAGVMAAAELAGQAGFNRIMTADMGGTSFDVALVVDGEPQVADVTKLEFRVPLQIPMIDVHTIGAGGGSIAAVDRSGILEVGPASAGSDPGPACYARGGTAATVTDANLVLHRIDPERPIGVSGGGTLDIEASRRVIGELAARLDESVERTAAWILEIVNNRMAGEMRLLSVERGHDPREFSMVAFGGAGPLHGAALLREVELEAMIVPAFPGVLCAMGCVTSDLRRDVSLTLGERRLEDLEPEEIARLLQDQREEAESHMLRDAEKAGDISAVHFAHMSYAGQVHALRVPIEPGWTRAQMASAFREQYAREFGGEPGDLPLIVDTLRTSVVISRPRPAAATAAALESSSFPEPSARRDVYFDGWHDTPVYQRATLMPGMTTRGPLIVDQTDCTVVIEPDMTVEVDAFTNLVVRTA